MTTGRLTQWAVIEAEIAVRRMSHDQKVRLADEIYAQQPNMLASILALPSMVQLEVVGLHILFKEFHNEHAERRLLAFVYCNLREHDLMAERTEAEKYLMMAALNLVECVAFVGTDKPRRWRLGSGRGVKMERPDAHHQGGSLDGPLPAAGRHG